MASFTQDTLKSQKIRDPQEADEFLKEIEGMQQAVQRQVTGGPVTGLNRFQTQRARNQWLTGEQQRRTQAAGTAGQLGSQIDERIAGTKNQLESVFEKYRNAQADLAQKQAQQSQLTDFEVEQGMWDSADKMRKLDFEMEKNQALRDDAIDALWRQGIAEDKLLDMGINHQLKMQDIDKYFALVQNEIEQDYLDWKNMTEIEFQKELARIESKAAAWGGILSGVLGAAGAVVGGIYGGPGGAVAGGTVGSTLGQGIGEGAS